MAKEHKQAVIAQKAIFTTGSMRLSRVVPSVLIAIVILAADVRFNVGEKVKIYLGLATEPIIYIPQFVREGWVSFSNSFEDRKILQNEILRLKKDFDGRLWELTDPNNVLVENSKGDVRSIVALRDATVKAGFTKQVLKCSTMCSMQV